MKRLLFLSAILLVAGSLSHAQVLTSAIPNDPGQLSFAVFGGGQSNVGNTPGLVQTLGGAGLAYGIGNRTEVDLVYEYGVFSGVPGMDIMLNNYILTLKYNLLLEAPFSLALGGNYTLVYQADNFAGSPSGNNAGVKLLASKIISSFLPYACLNRSFTSLGGLSNATEATAGCMWLATQNITWMAENTWQFQDAGFTSGQFSFCAAYTL